jgi:hypothetical protein
MQQVEISTNGRGGMLQACADMQQPSEVPKVKPPEIFQKTSMCKFHARHACDKGARCNFAHSRQELMPLPDLRCTRLCAKFMRTGTCEEVDCRFAHKREELRQLTAQEKASNRRMQDSPGAELGTANVAPLSVHALQSKVQPQPLPKKNQIKSTGNPGGAKRFGSKASLSFARQSTESTQTGTQDTLPAFQRNPGGAERFGSKASLSFARQSTESTQTGTQDTLPAFQNLTMQTLPSTCFSRQTTCFSRQTSAISDTLPAFQRNPGGAERFGSKASLSFAGRSTESTQTGTQDTLPAFQNLSRQTTCFSRQTSAISDILRNQIFLLIDGDGSGQKASLRIQNTFLSIQPVEWPHGRMRRTESAPGRMMRATTVR